jgi:hypothetical protein
MRSVTLRAWIAVGLSTAATARASAEAPPQARVVFARGTSLWMTDATGKTKAVEVATLPGGDVRMIRTNAAADVVIADVGGAWHWAKLPAAGEAPVAVTALPCAPGAARLSAKGASVICAGPDGNVRLVRLADGRVFERAAPANAASLAVKDGVRSMVWVDPAAGNIVMAPVVRPDQTTVVAPSAPLRGFLAAPDGSRGVGVYKGRPAKPKDAPERDELFGFALDGVGAKRRSIRDGVVIDWSWDAKWLLVQDGAKACIARATGGQFKCWKGYTAVSIAPDGAWALVLGPRSSEGAVEEIKAPADGGEGEGGGGDDGDEDGGDDAAGAAAARGTGGASLPPGPLSLYRAKLYGPYTEKPILIETVVDGAAVWLH